LIDLVEKSFVNLVGFYKEDLKKIHVDEECKATDLFTDIFIKGLISKGVIQIKNGYIRTHVLTDKTLKVLRLRR